MYFPFIFRNVSVVHVLLLINVDTDRYSTVLLYLNVSNTHSSRVFVFFIDNRQTQTASTHASTNNCCCYNKAREPLLPMLPLIPEHGLHSDSSSSTQCPLRPRPTSLYSLSHTRTLPHPPRKRYGHSMVASLT